MLLDAKLDTKLWAEAIFHTSCRRHRLPAQRVDLRIPFPLWTGFKHDVSYVLRFGQPCYDLKYRSNTVKRNKLLSRTAYGHLGMESQHASYRFLPTTNWIYFCRRNAFTILNKHTELPSFLAMTENISRHRQISNEEELDEPDIEDTQKKPTFNTTPKSTCHLTLT